MSFSKTGKIVDWDLKNQNKQAVKGLARLH